MPQRTRRRSTQLFACLCALIAIACSDQTTAPEATPPPDAPPAAPPETGPERTLSTNLYDQLTAASSFGDYFYVVGSTTGSLDAPARGSYDVFVRKYHPEGEMLWGSQFGTASDEYPFGAAVDRSGNLYVAGYTLGSLAGNRGGYDAFIRKYSSNGAVLWTRQFGSTSYDAARGVGVDSIGNVYVAGSTLGQFDGGGAFGGMDLFIRKYNPSGTLIWHRQWGTPALDEPSGLAVDAAGTSYVVGRSYGGTYGEQDAFIRSYTSAGAVRWIRWAGTAAADQFTAVALDKNSNPIAAGITSGAVAGPNAGGYDTFIRRYTSAGGTLFTTQFGTSGIDYANSISADQLGNYMVGGYTSGSLAGQIGGYDAFVRKYASANSILWTRQFGTSETDIVLAVAGRQSTALYVGGYTYGTFVGLNLGGSDAFLRKLDSSGNPIWTDQ